MRDVFLEINIYIHARPCVRVRARTRYYRATIIILPFHAFWLGRHHGRRRIAIFEFPSWSIHRADHLLGLMPRIYGTLPLSLSLSLSLYSSVYILPSLSRCVFSTLITNFDNIRSRSVNICMQNAGWGLYIFCIKRVCMKISVEPVNGAVYV